MKELSIQDVHGTLLNILRDVDCFCAENNLVYYLAYGTLLGAVRHKGFIPWDDDIDICMPRPDYERFIKLFPSEKGRIQVVSHKLDPNYPFYYAKVHDISTVVIENSNYNYKMGVYIDIFPIDAMPTSKKDQDSYMKKFNFYRDIYNIKSFKFRKGRKMMKNIILLCSKLITPFFSKKYLTNKLDQISHTYDYSESDLVSIAASIDQRLIFEKKIFSNGIKLKFEDIEASVPLNYHEILKRNYGNYMVLPPEEKRLSHHCMAYRL